MPSARIRAGSLPRQQLLGLESLQYPAQVATVQVQIPGELRRGDAFAIRKLVHHAHFGERVRAVQHSFGQHANAAGVIAVESADQGNLVG